MVRGVRGSGLLCFRGIPYARPPVGQLRLAAPVPPAPWTGVRDAARFGPLPPQSSLAGPAQSPDGVADPDEWLTVNVWSPDLPGSGRPVMVWIFGGAYLSGGATNPTYDGSRIALEGGVVVVTFNYRLGVEGFAQLAGAPPNRGLLDQVAVLEWVRDNAAAFGGDAEQVTVFGQSAGAGSVSALLAMPAAAGLFRRAIAQSVPRSCLSVALAESVATEIAAVAGATASRVGLAAVPPADLAAAGDEVGRRLARYADRWGLLAETPSPFAPVVDGTVLPRDPWQSLAAGASREVPLLTGHTREEYRLFLGLTGRLGTVSAAQSQRALRLLAPGGDPASYRAAYPSADAEQLYELVNSDWLFRMPSVALAQAHASAGGRSHVYELTLAVPGRHGSLGAPHGADVPLVFGNFDGGSAALTYGGRPSAAAEELGRSMRAAWTAFARTGDPGWPLFGPADLSTQVYGAHPTVARYPEETSLRLWADDPIDVFDLAAGAAASDSRHGGG